MSIYSALPVMPPAALRATTFEQPADCAKDSCSAISLYELELKKHRITEAKLRKSVIREKTLLAEMEALVRQKDILSKESEHRLLNGLQLITSLLTMQSRTAQNAETAAQLKMAANRVAMLGRIHRHLHALDHADSVELKHHLEQLARDLAGIAADDGVPRIVTVEGDELTIPTAVAIPLSFIASELITNAIKYAKGKIAVRLTTDPSGHELSITDDGPGLPEGFDPAKTPGLGMKLIAALAKQIGGEFRFAAGENGHGTRFAVAFS